MTSRHWAATAPEVQLGEKLYEGKAKIVYATDRPGVVVQYFKDDATAFNALKRGTILGKGVVNNRMSATLFRRLGRAGVPTPSDRKSPILPTPRPAAVSATSTAGWRATCSYMSSRVLPGSTESAVDRG